MFRSGKALRVLSTLLLGVFLLSFSLRMAHALFSHAHEHDQPACEAAYNGKQQHLHDDRYEPEHCHLCTFFFSTPVLPQPCAWVFVTLQRPVGSVFSVAHTYTEQSVDSKPGRGPPTA
ncbi:MAG: DUF2946 family protein [Saprospiraceae bacterium]